MHVRRRRVRVGYEYEYGLESPLDRPDIASRGRGGLSERLTELERVHTTEPPLFTTVSWVTRSILATRPGFVLHLSPVDPAGAQVLPMTCARRSMTT